MSKDLLVRIGKFLMNVLKKTVYIPYPYTAKYHDNPDPVGFVTLCISWNTGLNDDSFIIMSNKLSCL